MPNISEKSIGISSFPHSLDDMASATSNSSLESGFTPDLLLQLSRTLYFFLRHLSIRYLYYNKIVIVNKQCTLLFNFIKDLVAGGSG